MATQMERYITPPKSNKNGRAVVLCPFHIERTPSCVIDYKRLQFICLSCHRAGPVKYVNSHGQEVLILDEEGAIMLSPELVREQREIAAPDLRS